MNHRQNQKNQEMVLATRKEKSIQESVEITFHIMVIVKIRSSGLFSKVNEFFDLAVNEGGCDNAGFTNKDIFFMAIGFACKLDAKRYTGGDRKGCKIVARYC